MSHTTFGELENILEKERAKFRDGKEKLEAELDGERKQRIELENRLIKLKDEFSRKDVQLSEFEFRENNVLHQLQDYQIENEKLRAEIARLEDLFGGRVFELEGELREERRQNEEVLREYKSEFEKFKKEGLEYIETLNFEHDRKVKALEDKCKALELSKRELTAEAKKLGDAIAHNRLSFEEELRDLTNRLREEELRKTQFMAKSFDQRLRSVEDSKEALSRKIADLGRQLQDKERQMQEAENERADEVERLKLDLADFGAKYSQVSYLYDKAKNEIAQREAALSRNTGENSHEVGYLKQQVEAKRKEIDQLALTIKELRDSIKDQAAEFERKRNEVVDKSNFYEAEARRYKGNFLFTQSRTPRSTTP